VSYTKRLTYWVDSPDRDRMDDCRVHYRLDEEGAGTAQLLVEGQHRFVELLLRDNGEAEYATGTRGEPGTGRYLELADETDVDLLLERVVDEVRGWRTSPTEPGTLHRPMG
jgi:hypothetical protein